MSGSKTTKSQEAGYCVPVYRGGKLAKIKFATLGAAKGFAERVHRKTGVFVSIVKA